MSIEENSSITSPSHSRGGKFSKGSRSTGSKQNTITAGNKVYFIRKHESQPEVASAIFVDFYDDLLARVNTFFGQIYVQRKFFSMDPNDLYEIIESKSMEFTEFYEQLPNSKYSLLSSISWFSESSNVTSTDRIVDIKISPGKRKLSTSSDNNDEKPLKKDKRSKPRQKRPRAAESTNSSLDPYSSRSPSPTLSELLKSVTKKAQKADGALDLLKVIRSDLSAVDLSALDAEEDIKKLVESVKCSVDAYLKQVSSNSVSPSTSV